MTAAFYMNCVSAHQLPLAREVARLVGPENFCYVDAGEKGQEYQSCHDTTGIQVKVEGEGEQWMEESDLLLTGLRDLDLLERRAKKGLRTFYTSERWLKPAGVFSGAFRLLVPSYRRMAKRFVTWANGSDAARVLAIGPWAKKDFLRLGVRPEKIVDWGYFVFPSISHTSHTSHTFSLLWVGRMLKLKRVETVLEAVERVEKVERVERVEKVTLVGDGPEKERLRAKVRRLGLEDKVEFLPSQPMERIRELMREHSLLVLSSNGYEGWGAVVSEALEEGMSVIGTFEAGASAALLPRERLFHSGDARALAELIGRDLRGELPPCSIGGWTAAEAARRLVNMI